MNGEPTTHFEQSLREIMSFRKEWRVYQSRLLGHLDRNLANRRLHLVAAPGSVLATIGLTIPAVAGVAMFLGRPLTLGLGAKEELLLGVTLIVGLLTIVPGRTTVLQGIVHLVLFAVFLFFAAVP
jgi:Ca2+:H+ antiporter